MTDPLGTGGITPKVPLPKDQEVANANSLNIRFIFQGEVTTPLKAIWAETESTEPLTVRLPAGTTEVQKRILVDNPNEADLQVDSVDFQTTSGKVQNAVIVNGPIVLQAASTRTQVAIRVTFSATEPLEEITGTVSLNISEVS